MKKQILFYFSIICVLGFSQKLFSQPHRESYTLKDPVQQSSNYVARDYIRLTNGFRVNGNNGIRFSAKINPLLLFPPTSATYAKPDGTIVTSPSEGGVVGSVPGQFVVSGTGAATYAVPIECPAGVNGMKPNISLTYSSQSGNGIAGWGWNVAGVSMISKVPKSFYFDNGTDVIDWADHKKVALDGVRMITSNGTDYYLENNPTAKITRKYNSSTKRHYFLVELKSGIKAYYESLHFLLKTSGNGGEHFNGWLLTKQVNPNGSYVKYSYTEDVIAIAGLRIVTNNRITQVAYGHPSCGDVGKISFFYKNRKDKIINYMSGVAYRQEKLLDRIEVWGQNKFLRKYSLSYTQSNKYNKLQKITLSNHKGTRYNPTEIVWQSYPGTYPKIGDEYIANISEKRKARPIYGDFNGDGRTDFITYKDGEVTLFVAFQIYGDVRFSKKTNFKTYGDKPKGVIPADLNGDGKLDLISITDAPNGTYRYNFYFFNGEKFTNGKPSGQNGYYGFNTTKRDGDVLIGDFNGDGRHNVLIRSTQKVYNQYGSVIATGGIENWGNETLVPYINNKHLIDFTGNGKTNLCILHTGSATIYELENRKFVKKFTTSDVKYNQPGLVGDFNGDRVSDFLVQTSDSKKYFFLYGSGKGFAKKTLPDLQLNNKTYVGDFNLDGKSDFVVCNVNGSTKKCTFKLGISTGDGFRFENVNSQIDAYGLPGIPFWSFMHFDDFDGDGRTELCYDRYVDAMRFKSFTDKDNMNVLSVKNGLNERIDINYAPLNARGIYFESDNKPRFPLSAYRAPLTVVRSVNSSGSQYQSTSYTYKDIRIHRQGKGLLGFLFTKARNSTLKQVTETTNTLNTVYHALVPGTHVKKLVADKEVGISTLDYTFQSKGSKRFFLRLNSQQEENKLTGVKTKTTYSSYDSYANPKTVLKEYFNGSSNTGISEKQETTYVTKGAWCPNKPASITATKARGSAKYVRKVSFTYDSKGNLTQETKDAGDVNQVVTLHKSFDAFGNPKAIQVTANGKTRTTNLEYTSTGRFVKKRTEAATGFSTTYNYDENQGLLNYQVNHLGLKTSYEYDGFGRKTKTNLPDGRFAVTALQWRNGNGPSKAKYYKYTEISGKSPVWVWHDGLGRELRSETYGLHTNKKIITDTEYDNKGRVKQTFEPYFEGGTRSTAMAYEYDDYGRVTSASSPTLGTTKTTYNKLSTTVSSPNGTKTETYNAAGQLLTSTVNGRSVSYTYWPSGLAKTATPQGGTAVQTFYDLQGNRTKMIDPDAGTVENKYNGFGDMLWQKQTKSVLSGSSKIITTSYEYDGAGRVKSVTQNGKKTSHSYTSQGFLNSVKNSDHEIQYRYDEGRSPKLGLITSHTEKVGGKSFTFRTEYDTYNRKKKRIYPSGFFVTNRYTKYGQLTEIKDRSGTSVWKAETANALGQVTKVRKGSKTTTFGYDNRHRPSSIVASGIIDQHYSFSEKGNLDFRRDDISKQKEVFTYDSHNQLQSWEIENEIKDYISPYHRVEYDTHGNIVKNTDLGYDLVYDHPTKTHALTSIKGNPSLIANEEQLITYTDFNKVHTLKEGNKNLSLTYGINNQRRIGEFKTGNDSFKRFYFGDYEEDVEKGKVKKVHYINGGDGLAALYIEENGKGKFYYAYTDYLGSLTALTDKGGKVVERYAFGPWGNRRSPSNWREKDLRKNWIVDRGFTMHEHLDGFALINMNGRVYDPTVGRFLSPDPHIQANDYWLNYNRYVYGFNNPMSYIDPDGELAWFVPVIIGAVVGAYAGASIQSGTAAFWNWKQDAWKGAIVGGLIGAATGAMFSAAMAPTAFGSTSGFHTTGMVVGGKATAGWGITSSALQSASINMGLSFAQGQGLEGAWRSGLIGAASGAWTATGGLGLANKGLAGRLGYQMIGTAGRSIGNNWAAGEDLFSKVVVGVGPVNLTFGKDQKLLQWQNNLGNIAFNTVGLANLVAGGKFQFDWKNLSPVYSGGFIKKVYNAMSIEATGAHSVFSRNTLSLSGSLAAHEMRHVWQSRSMGDIFLLEYFTQGLFPALMRVNQYYGNYYEYTAEYGF